ncbi:MAG: caspase family protein [Sandarakinorhabdus sp.]|nr:caspase family protein [Sandarakinorhabdus sp.]
MLRSIILLLCLSLFGTPALAETRVALVIGAGNYGHGNTLANPANDARLVAGALRQSDFAVTELHDPDLAAFKSALTAFRQKARAADVALVYYAGHGIEVNGTNWLLPVSATGHSAADLDSQAIRASAVMAAVSGAKAVRLVVLDACRDNPYAHDARRPDAGSLSNVVLLLATQPGMTASDGAAHSRFAPSPFAASPFALAFAARIREPGLRLASLPARLALDLKARNQRPDQRGIFDDPDWMFVPTPASPTTAAARSERLQLALASRRHELTRQFVIPGTPAPKPKPAPAPAPAAKPKPAPAPVAPAPYDFERGAWNLCEKSKSSSPCDAYLAKYPNGKWADLARTRINDIATAPAPAPVVVRAPAAPVAEDKEKTDWLACQNSNASGPCERYLETYPTGRWAPQAKTRVATYAAAAQDKLNAEKAKAAAAQQASQQQAAAAQQAAQQQAAAAQEKGDFDACQSGIGPAACEKFIAAYPNSVRAAAARDRVGKFRSEGEESAAWGLCQSSSGPGACEKYLSSYPTGAHASAARDMATRFRSEGEEKSAWAQCQTADSAAPCERYLAAYRAGPNAGAASALIARFAKADLDRQKAEQEKTAWSLCEAGKTALPCNDYLRNFPTGGFAESARTRIRVLETAATEPEMVPALGLVIRRNDNGEMVIVSVQQYSSAMGNVFGGDVIVKINDQPTKPSDPPRQTIEAALAAASGRVKLLIRRGPAAVTAVIRARP